MARTLEVTGLVRDEGTVVVFSGVDLDTYDDEVLFAVDHRPAQDIVDALSDAHGREIGLAVEVEEWQVLG